MTEYRKIVFNAGVETVTRGKSRTLL